MPEVDETAHPVIPPEQASVEPAAPAPEEVAAPAVDESAQASAEPSEPAAAAPAEPAASADAAPAEDPAPEPDAEVPAVTPETPVEASVVSGNPDVSPATMTNPASAEATDAPFIVGPSGATLATITVGSGAVTPEPVVVQNAPLVIAPGVVNDPQALLDELTVVRADLARVSAERDKLDADVQRVVAEHTALHLALDDARRQLAGQPAAPVTAPGEPVPTALYSEIQRALGDFFLAHALPQLAEEPAAEVPASPFISRQ